MYKIKIDTSKRYEHKVDLVKLVDGIDTVVETRHGDIDVVTAVKELLEANNITPSQIDKYESFPGPGSFTGLKIGAVIANVMNWALGRRDINNLQYPRYGHEPNISKRKS